MPFPHVLHAIVNFALETEQLLCLNRRKETVRNSSELFGFITDCDKRIKETGEISSRSSIHLDKRRKEGTVGHGIRPE